MDIRFERCSAVDEYYDIYDGDKVIGEFRIYRDMDFECCGVKLDNFLGFIKIDRLYRNRGILKRIVREYRIDSLAVCDIDDMGMDLLKRIYSRLGFRLIEGSNEFMIRHR